jgi:hypothetical protein
MIRTQHIDKKINNGYTGQEIHYWVNSKIDTITFTAVSDSIINDTLMIGLNPLFNQLVNDYSNANVNSIPSEKMTLWSESPNIKIKIYFRYIWLHKEENRIQPASYGIDILYKIQNH